MKSLLITISIAIILAISLAIIPSDPVFSQSKNKGIEFQDISWKGALKTAKEEDKFIFLDVYATWCAPCKMMKINTFQNKEVSEFFNQNFINLSLDGEKEEGLNLVQKYGIRGYPSLLFIDPQGNLISGTTGYQGPSPLISWGKEILQYKNKADNEGE